MLLLPLSKHSNDARFDTDTTAPSFSSLTDALGYIVDQRRIEFAFEGNRYFTLKRLGPAAGRDAVKDQVDHDLEAKIKHHSTVLVTARFTLPIPLIEFNGNPNLRDQQNPGY